MFSFFKKDKVEEKVEKPVANAGVAEASTTKGRPGRVLTEAALRAHEAVEAVLTDAPQTRSVIIGKLDEAVRPYVNGNWQNIVARLLTQNKAKLADGSSSRGRGVSYTKA